MRHDLHLMTSVRLLLALPCEPTTLAARLDAHWKRRDLCGQHKAKSFGKERTEDELYILYVANKRLQVSLSFTENFETETTAPATAPSCAAPCATAAHRARNPAALSRKLWSSNHLPQGPPGGRLLGTTTFGDSMWFHWCCLKKTKKKL
jgi:hypothetical protein